MKRALRSILRLLGKGEPKVVAVFGFSSESCRAAVLHVHRGAPGVPVWLFSQAEPLPDTRPFM